jgi:hypothetical protein
LKIFATEPRSVFFSTKTSPTFLVEWKTKIASCL